MPMGDEDPRTPTPAPAGSRALTGGAIAAFIGVLLRIMGPDPVPGVPLNLRLLAYLFLGVGIFLLAVGLLVRSSR